MNPSEQLSTRAGAALPVTKTILPAIGPPRKNSRVPSRAGKLRTIFKKGPVRILLLLLVLAGGYLVYRSFFGEKSAAILSATVHQGPFQIVVVETGELRAKRSVNITVPMLSSGGRAQLAIKYLAQEGVTVDSGTLIVSLDPQDMSKALSDKRDQLTLDESDIEKTKAQQASDKAQTEMDYENAQLSYKLAKLTNESMKYESDAKQREAELDMKKADLALKQAKQNLKNKVVIQKNELENLRLKVTQDKAALDRINTDITRLDVHAPGSGLIVYNENYSTGRKFAKGDLIWSGATLGNLPDLSEMQAVVQVNEVDISNVKVGQLVNVALDAFPDKVFHGKVLNVGIIGNKKENNPSIKVFEVIVDIIGTDPVLKPGMTVSARIIVDRLDNVMSIPLESVFETNGKTFAYVQNGTSWDKREVKLGAKNDNFVVIESGVKAGENVALSDPTQLATQTTGHAAPSSASQGRGAGQSSGRSGGAGTGGAQVGGAGGGGFRVRRGN